MSDTAYAGYWEQIVPKQFIVQGLRQDVSCSFVFAVADLFPHIVFASFFRF